MLIVLVILLLFGAKKLPELARGSGRALRIFKAETKGLIDDDDDDDDLKTPEQREIEARQQPPAADGPSDRRPGRARAARRHHQLTPSTRRCPSPESSSSSRGKPHHPVGADGRMALSDHLRELRARVLKVAVILTVGLVVVAVLLRPDLRAGPRALQPTPRTRWAPDGHHRGHHRRRRRRRCMLYLKLCGLVSVVADQPAVALPDLGVHPPRACTRRSASGRGSSRPSPGRCSWPAWRVGYLTLPKGLEILIGFTPADLTNLVEFGDYLTFLIRMLLVFGIAFEIPVFVILLNLAGVRHGQDARARTGRGSSSARSSSPPSRRRRPTRSRC